MSDSHEVLRQRGLEHERAYVQWLVSSGKTVAEIDRSDGNAFESTLSAMQQRADVIVQSRLEHNAWAGWADVLLRVPGESSFGAWWYEPVETTLATETRGATLLQLCLYAEHRTTRRSPRSRSEFRVRASGRSQWLAAQLIALTGGEGGCRPGDTFW